MKAQRLTIQCPICHQPIPRGVKEHLYEHSKSDLVRELLGYIEGEDVEEE